MHLDKFAIFVILYFASCNSFLLFIEMGQRAHPYMQVLYIFNIYSSTHRFCLEWSAADIQRYVMPCGRGSSFIKEVNTLVAKVNMIGKGECSTIEQGSFV